MDHRNAKPEHKDSIMVSGLELSLNQARVTMPPAVGAIKLRPVVALVDPMQRAVGLISLPLPSTTLLLGQVAPVLPYLQAKSALEAKSTKPAPEGTSNAWALVVSRQ